jgi:dihydroorotate dehydrogenase (NAD+) catalytic subunit
MDNIDMSVDLAGIIMKNPVTVASGTFGIGREFSDFIDIERLGAITSKGVSLDPWEGNDSPRIAETPSGMLNSIGLQNPGVEVFCSEYLSWFSGHDVPLIVNVSGHSVSEYVEVIERLEDEDCVTAYELNISCPNVDKGGMTFGTDPVVAASVVRACREATSRPLITKLTPNVTDITVIARAVEEVGSDAVSLINTVLGMSIDVKRRKPVLARAVGGLSGPAIKPIALRMVFETWRAVSIPIIGMGGISSASDALEFMLAGASAVSVGTANFIDPTATIEIIEGMRSWCADQGVKRIGELVGGLVC